MSGPLDQERLELNAIASGDALAFAHWASRVEGPLRRSLTRLAAIVDAEAVIQETLLRVWNVAPRFAHDGAPRALERFATRTARNVAITEWRRFGNPAHRQALEQALAEQETESRPMLPDPHLRAVIERCREKLPGKPAEALEARLSDGGATSDEVLAQRLGVALNTFLQNFTRARKFLRECLAMAGVRLEEELP